MNPVNLNKGNCFIYSILFKWHNPKSKIVIYKNKYGGISFATVLDGRKYYYVPIVKVNKPKFIFKGTTKSKPYIQTNLSKI